MRDSCPPASSAPPRPRPTSAAEKPEVETKVPVVIELGKTVKIKVEIEIIGNAKPKGTITFVVRKPNGKVVKRVTREYDPSKRLGIGKLPEGKYKVRVKFAPKNNRSVYKKSSDLVKFKVEK